MAEQNYRELIGALNNHENHQHADKLTVTGLFKTINEYSLHVKRMLDGIPTKDLDLYKTELEACGYDLDFIKSLR